MLRHVPFYASLLEEELADGTKAKTGHILVYGAIEAHAMGEYGCIASNATIAKETGLKESSVATIISVIAKAGWIYVTLNKNNHRQRIDPLMVIKPPHKQGSALTTIKPPLTTIKQNRQNNSSKNAPKDSNKKKVYKKEESLKLLLEDLISLVNPKEKPTEDRQRLLNARLKEYSFGEIKNAARAFSGSKWHRDNGQMSIDNLLRPSKFGRWYSEGLELEPEADAVEDPIVKAAGDAFPARWPKGKPEWSEDDDENRYFRGVKIDHTNQGEIMKIEEARRGA